MKLPPPQTMIGLMLFLTIACYLAAVMMGVCSCIVAGFMGLEVGENCKTGFREPMAAILATLTALWATNRNRV